MNWSTKQTILALMVVAGCTQVPVSEPVPVPAPLPEEEDPNLTLCLKDEQRALVGQPESVARATLPPDSRIHPAGSLIAQDYLPFRFNADLDANGIVVRVWCG